MIPFNRLRRLPLLLALLGPAVAALSGGCTTVDDSLGSNIVPETQQMKTGYLRLDDVRKRYVETRLYQTDSIVSSNLGYGYMGSERNDTIGLRTAGFLTQYLNYYAVDEGYFGYRPIFDSATMMISIEGYGADTLTPQRFNVYEITDNGYLTSSEDSIFFLSFDPEPFVDLARPLFTFTFPDGKTTGPATTTVRLDATPEGRTFVLDRLMLQGEEFRGEDGEPDYSIYAAGNEKEWVEHFKGFYIRPAEDQTQPGKGTIYATKLEASGLAVYGRNRVKEDPSLIQDTIGMAYLFYDSYVSEAGNISVNTLKRDYAGSLIDIGKAREPGKDAAGAPLPDTRPLDTRVVVEGMSGVVTELRLTKEFFQSLEDAVRKANEADGTQFNTLAFNQACMSVYFTDSDYDWQQIASGNTARLIEQMNAAPNRLGLFSDFKRLAGIADYAYQYEQNYSTTLAYGGYINRSRGCYTMDITGHIQKVWNNYLAARDAAGGIDAIDWDDPDAVTGRTIYLAPEAYGLYTTAFTVVQGMGGDAPEGEPNRAPIRFELTYNLLKK